jgi:hypothetical protein
VGGNPATGHRHIGWLKNNTTPAVPQSNQLAGDIGLSFIENRVHEMFGLADDIEQ